MSITPGTHRLRPDRHRDALPAGTSLHTYVVEEIVGQGGFGIVYRARHGALRHRVAIKEYFPLALAVRENGVVSPRGEPCEAPFEDGLERFREEARLLVEFEEHPNVVSCRDFFSGRGTAYMVMDFEDGKPLSQLLREREAQGRPFGEEDLRAVMVPLLKGLGSVHSDGVLHRDIKPANILIRRADHCPVLIDFGTAKHSLAERTCSFAAYTEGYAALEQVGDGRLGPWTDIYGVGAVMWRMVAGGHPPWAPPNPIKVEQRASRLLGGESDPLPAAAVLGAGTFPPPLLELVDYCLAVPWEKRPQDCDELVGILNGTHKDNKPALHTPKRRSSVSRRRNLIRIPDKHKPTSRLSTKRILIASATALIILACATFSYRLSEGRIADDPETSWSAIAETTSENQLQRFLSRYGHDISAREWVALATERLALLRSENLTPNASEDPLRSEARESWNMIRDSNEESELNSYIEEFQSVAEAQPWVRLAKNRIDDIRRVRENTLSIQKLKGEVQSHWERIKNSQDESEFSAFIEEFEHRPEGEEWIREAKTHLQRLGNQRTARAAWQIARRSNSEVAILEFIKQYGVHPEAKQLVTVARSQLEELQRNQRIREANRQFLTAIQHDWNRIKTSPYESVFKQFIERYRGNYQADSWLTLAKQQLLKLNDIRRAREEWEELRETSTREDLARYIDQYEELPEASTWVSEAVNKLDQLKRGQITTSTNDTITGDIRADWDRIKLDGHKDLLNAFIEYYSAGKRNAIWVDFAKEWLVLNEIPREVTNSIGMEFVLLPPGKFQMGTSQSMGNRNHDEGPTHEVTVSQGFYLGKYEVTQRQWSSVMGQNPSWFERCDQCPVERVSWFDVTAFIRRLNSIEGDANYRLPTEAEWEYAALGNTNEALYGNLNEIGWYLDNSDGRTHVVGGRVPNRYGLYDLLGNVWEWVQDWYGPYQTASQIDPVGPSRGSKRVTRGCSWVTSPSECRTSARNSHDPSERFGGLGFRLLRHTARLK